MKKTERKNKAENNKRNIRPGTKWLVGIDEVGRGPLAGPVAVCACAVPYHKSVKESYKKFLKEYEREIKALKLPSLRMRDSKKLSAPQRENWKRFLEKTHARFSYKTSSPREIDSKGISWCISGLIKKTLAVFSKIYLIHPENSAILLDGGLKAPKQYYSQFTVIKGDEKELVISMASIMAKVMRDEYMCGASEKEEFKIFGFERHKGYGTASHRKTIGANGTSPLHRLSFCTRILLNRKASRAKKVL